MNAQVGMKVKAYTGICIGNGMLIQSTTWNGEIIKVNKKSIRVRLTDITSKFCSEVTIHNENVNVASYRFVKTLDNGKDLYKSEANAYGSIDI